MKSTAIIGIIFLLLLTTPTFASHQENNDYDNDTILNQHDNCPYTPNAGVAGELIEGQSKQFTAGGTTYTATLTFVDAAKAKFTINGENTSALKAGEKSFLQDSTQIIVREIFYQDFATGIHGASFLIGGQKDSDGNGLGDACPNYDNESKKTSQYLDEFEELEEQFFLLREEYRKNRPETAGKLEELLGKFGKLQENVRTLLEDLDENQAMSNLERKKLQDILKELEEEVVRLQGRITDLLEKNKTEEQPLSTLSALSTSPALSQPQLVSGTPGGSKVTVFRFNLPSSSPSAVSEPETVSQNEPAIFWLITAIAIVLIMLLFLILAGMGR